MTHPLPRVQKLMTHPLSAPAHPPPPPILFDQSLIFCTILITPGESFLVTKFPLHKYHFSKQLWQHGYCKTHCLILVDGWQPNVKIILFCESESWLLPKSFITQTCLMSSHFEVCLLVWKTSMPNRDAWLTKPVNRTSDLCSWINKLKQLFKENKQNQT